ncbi:hypothetical protein K227x_05630 [Rubripirellula lacrimiformis]|uniref:Uncharacterized protein n=1 Tax=Rubripirellula lacrimiformis TaxID=1930273 RepID=A0A517N505_9BACT|nr:hypothetical protein K227x_05630 [Rubripirellula lacrimiformis]
MIGSAMTLGSIKCPNVAWHGQGYDTASLSGQTDEPYSAGSSIEVRGRGGQTVHCPMFIPTD